MSRNRILAMFSGGLDSTIGLFKAVDMGYEIPAVIFFNYGQKAWANEYDAAMSIPALVGAETIRVDLPFMWDFESALHKEGIEIPVVKSEAESRGDRFSPAWFPNRNMILISIATAYAHKFGCGQILFGPDAVDTMPDTLPDFIAKMNHCLLAAMPHHPITLFTPLINLTRWQMVRWGVEYNERNREEGQVQIPWHRIWSCRHAGAIQCGECNPCFANVEAFKDAPKAVRAQFNMKGLS